MRNPFKYFKTSPAIIRLAVMMCIRFPLSLLNVEDLLHERHLNRRETFKQNRSVALAEWRQLAA